MCRNIRSLQKMSLALTTLLLAPLLGCQATPASPKPIPPEQRGYRSVPLQPAHAPELPTDGLNLFGDRPDYEPVPFENRVTTNITRHTNTVVGLDFDPDVHDRLGELVFASTRNSEHPDIYVKNVNGATLTQITNDPADDIQPRFSPDGTQVVFASNRGGTWDVWLTDRDGMRITQLTDDETDEVAPCFSPDGSQIAYTRWSPNSRQWEIWTLSLDQPGVRRFLAYGMFPCWSPDGQRIAFQRARQRGSHLFSVWTITLVDGEARRPTEVAHVTAAACIAPRWSPDGKMIVYCVVPGEQTTTDSFSGTPTEADLWVVDADTGVRMRLTDGQSPAFNPVWTADARVFFVSPRAGTENIWSLTTELGGYARVTPDPDRLTLGDESLTQDR